MKVGDKVKINYRGEPAYRYSRSEDHPTKGFYYENGDEAVVIDPNYYKQEIREHTNLAGYTFPISVTLEGVLVLIDGEQVVVKEKDLEKVIVENEEEKDIAYLRKNLFESLNIPKDYLNKNFTRCFYCSSVFNDNEFDDDYAICSKCRDKENEE